MSPDARPRRPTHRCERCATSVVAVQPHVGWRVLAWATFAFFFPLTFAFGASGSLLFGGGIVLFVMGASIIGPLARTAFEEPRCPRCRCVVTALAPSRARRLEGAATAARE